MIMSLEQPFGFVLAKLFLVYSNFILEHFLRNCIIDKNAKIGRNVIIANADVSAVSTTAKYIDFFADLEYIDFSGCSRSGKT